MRYKVKSGFHSDGEIVYRKDQVFDSDKPLHKMFKNKFEIVASNKGPIKKTKTKKKEGEKKPRYNQADPLEEMGKDVTQRFPDAINQGLRVFQTVEGEYNVSDESDLFTPKNKKPLSRIGIKKFLLAR